MKESELRAAFEAAVIERGWTICKNKDGYSNYALGWMWWAWRNGAEAAGKEKAHEKNPDGIYTT